MSLCVPFCISLSVPFCMSLSVSFCISLRVPFCISLRVPFCLSLRVLFCISLCVVSCPVLCALSFSVILHHSGSLSLIISHFPPKKKEKTEIRHPLSIPNPCFLTNISIPVCKSICTFPAIRSRTAYLCCLRLAYPFSLPGPLIPAYTAYTSASSPDLHVPVSSAPPEYPPRC